MKLTVSRPATVGSTALRLLVAGALVVDAVVHLQLAPLYDQAAPGGIGQGNLFRLESGVAVLVAVLVLLVGNRLAFGAALLVAASALGAVLLYRYVDVPALGPIPKMYEPLWFTKKVVATVAEAVGVLAAVLGLRGHRAVTAGTPGAR
jgi:hypothetical protein